jgi:hypothetical protein
MVVVADRPEPTETAERDGTLAAAGTKYMLAAQADETELGEAVAAVESASRTGNLEAPRRPTEQQQLEAERPTPAGEEIGYRSP